PMLIMSAVPVSETAAANAFNTLLRSIGSSVASAASGVILAQMTTTFAGHALPSENSFKVIMAIGCGAALVALLLASFLPRQRPGATAPGAPARTPATSDAGRNA
ncbi:MFS transporter, partial [Streptomyces sp. MCAF7]